MASNRDGLSDFGNTLFSSKASTPDDVAGGVNAVGGTADAATINRANRTAYGGQTRIYNPDGTVKQQSGADQAVDKYQGLAGATAQRQAYQANYGGYDASMGQAQGAMGQSQQARGSQQDALGLQQQAAMGNAPSAAQIQGQQMIGQSLQAQMAGAASARGGSLAQAAAMHSAANGAAAFQQQGIGQLSALRAQEMAGARDAYAGESNALRQSDYTGAGLDYQGAGLGLQQTGQQQQNEQFQRQLNQQGQMGYDQMAAGVRQQDQQASLQQAQIDAGNWQHQTDLDEHSTDRDTNVFSSALGAVGSGFASIFSDRRVKKAVVPLGKDPKLDDMLGARQAQTADADAPWLSNNGREPFVRERPVAEGEDPKLDEIMAARQRQTQTDAAPAPWLDSDMDVPPSTVNPPATQIAPQMDIVRENPYAGAASAADDRKKESLGSLIGKGVSKAFSGGVIPMQRTGTTIRSDERLKLGIAPLSRMSSPSPMSGPANSTGDYAIKGGGMDVMGTLKNMSNEEAQTRMPTMQQRGLILSDPSAKRQAYILGYSDHQKGQSLRWTPRPGEILLNTKGQPARDETGLRQRQPGKPGFDDMTPEEHSAAREALDPMDAIIDSGAEHRNSGEAQSRSFIRSALDKGVAAPLSNAIGLGYGIVAGDAAEYGNQVAKQWEPPPARSRADEQHIYEPRAKPLVLVQGAPGKELAYRGPVVAPAGIPLGNDPQPSAPMRPPQYEGASIFDVDPNHPTPSDERAKRGAQSLSDPMGPALDAMQPYAYKYKPGVGEDPNRQQVGPMAQPMARDPVASTAIVRDARTGLLAIDPANATKLALGGLGYLKDRQDQTDRSIAAIAARMGPRRG